MDRIHVDLNGPPETMLATLYAKALDADAPRPILGDQYAKAAVAQIDYDWETTAINARRAPSVVIRALHFDNWTRQFLAVHDPSKILKIQKIHPSCCTWVAVWTPACTGWIRPRACCGTTSTTPR